MNCSARSPVVAPPFPTDAAGEQALQKPLAPTTPRRVYTWFHYVYRTNLVVGAAGYALAIAQGLIGPHVMPDWCAELAIMAVFYGLYFGVLGRDAAEVAAEKMSTTLGYCKKDDDLLARAPPENLCALCGEEFVVQAGGSDSAIGEVHARPRRGSSGGRGSSPERQMSMFGTYDDAGARGTSAQDAGGADDLVKLQCGHVFHRFCAAGWSIVGKKDTCPFCGEKVSLAAIAGSSPWKRQTLAWSWLLDMVRYLMSWHPVVLFFLQFIMFEAGY